MKVIGKMTCNMALVLKLGLMAPDMKVTILKEEKMALVAMNGMMAQSTQETGLKIR